MGNQVLMETRQAAFESSRLIKRQTLQQSCELTGLLYLLFLTGVSSVRKEGTGVLPHLLQGLSMPRNGKGKRETSFLASQEGLGNYKSWSAQTWATNPWRILSGFLPGQRISKRFEHSSYLL